ncbi:MAG: MFS transporter [Gaiella sp.]
MVAPLTRLGDRTFGSLRRHRDYRLFFAGSGISFVGTWMQQIAAFWLVLELTGSPLAVGALALVQTLPVTVLALVGGAIADRVSDLRRMVVVCEAVLCIEAALLCFLALSGLIETWHLYALGLAYGVAVAVNAPSRHTLVFRIVGREDLTNAIALSASLGTTARILGPAIGGVVLATLGPGAAFGLNAASYVVVIAALLAMRIGPRPPGACPPPGVLAGIGQTLRFAVSSRRVAVVFFSLILVSTLSFNFDVLLPLVAGLTLDEGPGVYGLIAAVFGAGALTGALILATIGRARVLLVLGGALGFGLLQLVLGQQDSLPAICVLLYACGIVYILWGSSSLATLQLAAPEDMRARAASLYFFGFMGGAPLGGLIAGALTAHGGTELAFTVAGAMAVLVVAAGASVLLSDRSARAAARAARAAKA